MSKLKKIVCAIAFTMAVLVMTITMTAFQCVEVYASANTSVNDIEQLDVTNGNQVLDAQEDANRTFSLYYNNENGGMSSTIQMMLVLTIIALAPSILIMLTSFTRIIIVLHFTRTALGTQSAPPNQVLVGLALFLTLFIMNPVMTEVRDTVIRPLDAQEITQEEAMERIQVPFRDFMYGQTKTRDINLFCDIANVTYEEPDEIPMTVLIPSFIISELRAGFIIGFLIYIPFIVIDMVVSSVLMSMGMMMLPPTTISMPFKILLFILADGWSLIIGNVVKTFY